MKMGPPVSQVRNVPLGKMVDVEQLCGVAFHVLNDGNGPMDFNVQALKPEDAGSGSWERGYDPVPDATWFHLEPAVVKLPQQQTAKVKLFVNIPDKPEYANRKFMLCVVTKPGAKPTFGPGLALCARVMFETEVRENTEGVNGGPIALTPGTVRMTGAPGQEATGTFKLRNNSTQDQTYVVRRYQQVYQDSFRDEREKRYLSTGFEFVPPEGWAALAQETWTVKAGDSTDISVKAKVPATALSGKNYEELLFVGAQAVMAEAGEKPADPNQAVQEKQLSMTFVRLQYSVK